MQQRQLDRRLYFKELATTSEKYFVPYLENFVKIGAGTNVLEIGCGDGGNLLPFAKLGCSVVGCDIADMRINDARKFFSEEHVEAKFIACDAFLLKDLENQFDIILCHDVIEHIYDKIGFMTKCKKLLKSNGIIFMSFPAWQMPFGGHQQICKGFLLSHLPFMHLLPNIIYKGLLKIGKERAGCIKELMNIKQTRCSVELFENVLKRTGYTIENRIAWFINPHYEVKFGLKPRKLYMVIDKLPYIRDFFTTSSFYVLKK